MSSHRPTSLRLIGFFRHWLLIGLFIAFALIALNDRVFAAVGTFAYAPALVTLGALCALLLRNVFNADTTDADSDSGYTRDTYKTLTPRERLLISKVEFWIYLLAAAHIIAAIAK
ncbi:MAG: hypothetical protein QM755_02715 [Luteolibacter sp.]